MGDCIMAFWGAPCLMRLHARNAILAAIEMQQTLGKLQRASGNKDGRRYMSA